MSKIPFPQNEGMSLEKVIEDVYENILADSININHQKSMAHLHCPVMIPSLIAEMIISALNQSMDSWDQSSVATYVEVKLVQWLCEQIGFAHKADGVFTSGGTQSNYMGLLLARNSYCKQAFNWDVKKKGLPVQASSLRIFCSEDAHFSVVKSASQLGLGEDAVITVKKDEQYRMCIKDLKAKLEMCKEEKLYPFAIVGTCGSTDLGAIDPLEEIAELSREYNTWYHIDAAYGGALILSDSRNALINGLELADSVTVDFHKLFFQPISCGAFLVKNASSFKFIEHNADYLNPKEDQDNGIIHLVGKSIQTTRRFDALKVYFSLLVVGMDKFGGIIDHICTTATEGARYIQSLDCFDIVNSNPQISTIVFRYNVGEPGTLNQVNEYIYKKMLQMGNALLAKTTINQSVYLKFTILNPLTTIDDIKEVVKLIESITVDNLAYSY